jgi:hypothetical protein
MTKAAAAMLPVVIMMLVTSCRVKFLFERTLVLSGVSNNLLEKWLACY